MKDMAMFWLQCGGFVQTCSKTVSNFVSSETRKLLDSGLTVFKLVRRMSCSNVFWRVNQQWTSFRKMCIEHMCVWTNLKRKKTTKCNGKPLLPTDNLQSKEKKTTERFE